MKQVQDNNNQEGNIPLIVWMQQIWLVWNLVYSHDVVIYHYTKTSTKQKYMTKKSENENVVFSLCGHALAIFQPWLQMSAEDGCSELSVDGYGRNQLLCHMLSSFLITYGAVIRTSTWAI